jgi:hypothetical protein
VNASDNKTNDSVAATESQTFRKVFKESIRIKHSKYAEEIILTTERKECAPFHRKRREREMGNTERRTHV